MIRGLAALAVFIGHLRIIFFRDTPTYALNVLGKLVFFVTGFGHISVTLFFTLSGFLIIGSIHEAVLKDRWTFSNYSFNRLTRLWIVLIPCLFLGLFWDKVGLNTWGNSFFYSNQWHYFINQDLANKMSPTIFLGNVFFVQKILVPTLGTNESLWSLANEFWYYVIFPLLYFACFNFYKKGTRIIFAVAAVALLFFVGKNMTLDFILWLYGGLSYVLIKYLNPDFLKRKIYLIGLTILFLFIICMTRSKFYPDLFSNYSIGLVFALMIPFLTKAGMKHGFLRGISNYLSDISYTLYLAHLPIIYFITSMLSMQNLVWSNKNCLLYFLITLVVFIYSRLVWYIFERNTKKLKDWINKKKLLYSS